MAVGTLIFGPQSLSLLLIMVSNLRERRDEFNHTNITSIASSNIVALCGADTVELIDVAQGRVVKKYSHMEQKEEFFCLAWTTLTSLDSWSQEKSYNILAAAGKLGTIKLFNPTQSECYRYLFGHSKQISRLAFSKSKRRWLLSKCSYLFCQKLYG
jgi:WD40 repeat protein